MELQSVRTKDRQRTQIEDKRGSKTHRTRTTEDKEKNETGDRTWEDISGQGVGRGHVRERQDRMGQDRRRNGQGTEWKTRTANRTEQPNRQDKGWNDTGDDC